MIQYLSAETILVLHSEVIDASGGSHGVRDPGLLASIADKPRAAFGGTDAYPDVFMKAAVYLEAVAKYHVFIDGNKRTSFVVAARFLFENGYEFVATDAQVEMFVLEIVRAKTAIAEIAAWLATHAEKMRAKTTTSRTMRPRRKKRR